MKQSYDEVFSPPCDQTAVAQVNGLSVSRFMSCATLHCLKTLSCTEKYREHWRKNPLHQAGSPEYLSGHARSGGAVGNGATIVASDHISALDNCTNLALSMAIYCCCTSNPSPWDASACCQSSIPTVYKVRRLRWQQLQMVLLLRIKQIQKKHLTNHSQEQKDRQFTNPIKKQNSKQSKAVSEYLY